MKIAGPNRTATATATYKADSKEENTNSKVNRVDNEAVNIHSMKMAMRYFLVDSNRCLNGQYKA